MPKYTVKIPMLYYKTVEVEAPDKSHAENRAYFGEGEQIGDIEFAESLGDWPWEVTEVEED